MTKVRRPGTVEAALWRCKEILGIEQLADICGKSESMITRYLDIDDELRNLPAKYIPAIDRACKEVNGETPLTSHLNRRVETGIASNGCPKGAGLEIATEAGRVCHLIDLATSPTGPGNERITHTEAMEILPALDQVDRATERARSKLKRYTRTDIKAVG